MASLKRPLSNLPKCPKHPQSYHKQGAKPVTRETGRHRGSSGNQGSRLRSPLGEVLQGTGYSSNCALVHRQKCCTRQLQLSPGQSEATHTIRRPSVAATEAPATRKLLPQTQHQTIQIVLHTVGAKARPSVITDLDRLAFGARCVRTHQAVLWWHLPLLREYLLTGFKKHTGPDTRLLQQSGCSRTHRSHRERGTSCFHRLQGPEAKVKPAGSATNLSARPPGRF